MESLVSKKHKASQPTLEAILGTLQVHLPELKQTREVKTLGVFGSYARGDNKLKSDVDLLVEFQRAPTMFEFIRLERHLADLLGVKVDLVMKTSLKPEIGQRILGEVVPV